MIEGRRDWLYVQHPRFYEVLGAGESDSGPGTMGRRTERPDPNDYLKGQTKCKKVSSRVDVQKFDRPIGTRKEPVPRPHERPVLGLHTAKNFVTANAVEAILQVPAVRYSEEPDYMAKQDYGKVPAYLSQVKEEIKRENEMIDQYVQEQMGLAGHAVEDPGVEMDPEERQQIILALKKKWDHTNRQYQLCTAQGRLPLVRRQGPEARGLEDTLKQLEADIAKLEKPAPIFVKRSPHLAGLESERERGSASGRADVSRATTTSSRGRAPTLAGRAQVPWRYRPGGTRPSRAAAEPRPKPLVSSGRAAMRSSERKKTSAARRVHDAGRPRRGPRPNVN